MRFDWRRVLIYTHRWLGIAGCIVFIVWFVSGVVMMYARMPRLTAEERLMRLPLLDLAAVRVPPAEAIGPTGIQPERVRVGSLDGRPVYRILSQGTWSTVFADTGEPLQGLDADDAVSIVRRFIPEHAATARHAGRLVDPDQWTLDGGLPRFLPMHRVALGDPDDTYVYVSERTGEAVMKTTAEGRAWGFLGAVLHWIYFTPFRRQQRLWSQSIIYFSFVGCAMCLVGLATGIWRYSMSRRYRLKGERSRSPYAGLMWWHHYAGLIFGLASFTWALSGAFSLNPGNWSPSTAPTADQVAAVAGGSLRLDQLTLPKLREAAATIARDFSPKELEVLQFRGEPVVMAYRPPRAEEAAHWTNTDLRAFVSAQLRIDHRLVWVRAPQHGMFTRFPDDAVLAAARAAMPGVPIEDATWLSEYDAYYYDRHDMRPLPMLRVRYSDRDQTWLYLDPQHGLISMRYGRLSRVNRWLYHGLHSLDFPFLYRRRPLWDVVVIVLSLGGLALSSTTIVAAWRRLRRQARRLAHQVWPDDERAPARDSHSPRSRRHAEAAVPRVVRGED